MTGNEEPMATKQLAVTKHGRVTSGRSLRAGAQGFTLVELMVVVAIVGVLGAIASYGVTRYVHRARVSEATGMLASIRGAQEAYRQETFRYLDVSGDFAKLHPSTTPGAFKRSWEGDGDNATTSANFRTLGVSADGGVYFSYGCVAGDTGDAFPAPPTSKQNFGLPAAAVEPFYVAVARGDTDGDGIPTWLLTHSLTNEIYIEGD